MYGISLHVKGERALFTRPEMKAERVSYDVITPSAARGILDAIYWHPGLKWVIDKITVLNPVRFDSVRRNELKGKAPRTYSGSRREIGEDRTQRASLMLRDVAYIIDAHFELRPGEMNGGDGADKFIDIFRRRARKGQCHHQPCFGCREFPAFFELIEDGAERPASFYAQEESRDLGYMLSDFDYKDDGDNSGKTPDERKYIYIPKFFRAEMKRGVITVPREGIS